MLGYIIAIILGLAVFVALIVVLVGGSGGRRTRWGTDPKGRDPKEPFKEQAVEANSQAAPQRRPVSESEKRENF